MTGSEQMRRLKAWAPKCSGCNKAHYNVDDDDAVKQVFVDGIWTKCYRCPLQLGGTIFSTALTTRSSAIPQR